MNVVHLEKPLGVIATLGGQTASTSLSRSTTEGYA